MSQLMDIVAWWLAVEAAGLAALPLAAAAAGSLPGRGYAYAKPVGVLVVAYLFWLGVSLNVFPNGAAGAGLALVVVAVAAWAPAGAAALRTGGGGRGRRGSRGRLAAMLPGRGVVAATEAAWLLVFVFVLVLRARHPGILGSEKPYELAMLNATLNASHFPPPDPWLSGFSLNYYYFGYVVVTVLAQLARTGVGVAYNLGGAAAMGLAAAAAFGVGYDLAALRAREPEATGDTAGADPVQAALPRPGRERRGLLGGVGAVLLLLLAGNYEVWVEAVHAVNATAGQALGQWLRLGAFTPAFRHEFWFPPAHDWWLRASLVLKDVGLAGDPRSLSTEFPMFNVLQGDVHAPVLSLWITVLVMGLSLAVLVRAEAPVWPVPRGDPSDGAAQSGAHSGGPSNEHGPVRRAWPAAALQLLLLALALGALWAGNAWALPPFGMLAALAYLGRMLQRRGWSWRAVAVGLAGGGVALGGAAYLWFLPFHRAFESPVGGIGWNFFSPTSLRGFLVELGVFLPGTALLLALAQRDAGRRLRGRLTGAVAAAVLLPLVALVVALIPVLRPVAAENHVTLTSLLGLNLGILFKRRLAAAGAYLVITGGVAWAAVLAAVHMRGRTRPGTAFAVVAVFVAVLFLLVPEVVWLSDDLGWRYNTVLKFHFAAWTLLAIAVAAVLPDAGALLARGRAGRLARVAGVARVARVIDETRSTRDRDEPVSRPRRRASALALPVLATLTVLALGCGAAYPLAAGWSYLRTGTGWTLDGTAARRARYADDAPAIQWLCGNAHPGDVIVEVVGQAFTDAARISASTGLPAVLGWPNHERTVRGPRADTLIDRRRRDVQRIYTTPDPAELRTLLQRYHVRYVYLGAVERSVYPAATTDAALRLLPVAYASGRVRVYRVAGAPPAGAAGLRCRIR